MDPVAYAFAIAVPSAFVLGVLFHKYIVSESAAIKQHVTDEIAEARADIGALGGKISKL
jgi:hypothetical protein